MNQVLLVACLAALSIPVHAHAFSLISIGAQQTGVNGGTITTLTTDGGTGSAVYTGSYGTFTFNTVTAQGSPLLPSGSLATTSIQTSAANAGTIAIYITEQGLTAPVGSTSFMSSFTSNLFSGSAISVVESTYFSPTNAIYGGNQLASRTFTGIDMGWVPSQVNVTGTYSETIKYLITVGSGFSSVNDTINVTTVTPEPSSLVLSGSALLLLGTALLYRRRRFNTLAI